MSEVALREITERLGGELIGDGSIRIASIGPLESATPSTIAFLSNPRYAKQLGVSAAGCVIVAPAHRDVAVARGATIVSDDPYLYFARLTQWWAERIRPRIERGVHPSAVVDAGATLGAEVSIGAFAVVESGAILGAGVTLGAHAFVGRDCRIGAGTRLAPRVTVLYESTLGARCFVQSGAVIGADGFGFAPDGGRWVKIEQLGRVVIGDDVEIGANTCIDRGALEDTVLEDGVKLDNLIQIAHNVHIGRHTAMAACVGVAGSAHIGAHCTFGGAAMIAGHLQIADYVNISPGTLVSRSISKPGTYTGFFPMDDNASWEKNAATLRQLHTLRDRLRTLEKQAKPIS